jgi:ABC-type branched-subunit amino acid transport system substrate-binding protein
MSRALTFLANWVNDAHGGVRISSTQRKRLQIVMVDDASSPENAASITESLVSGKLLGRPIPLLLGPYSSELTEAVAAVANMTSATLMATAAAATSVFADRPRVFGLLPPAQTFLHVGIQQLHDLGVKSVVFLQEELVASRDYCQGAVEKARSLNMTIAGFETVASGPNRTEIGAAIAKFHALKPDAMVGCTITLALCKEVITQAGTNESLPFYVKAMLFTTCVTAPDYFRQLGPDLGSFVLGVTPWFDTDTTPDELMSMSAAGFTALFASELRPHVSYQAAAALSGARLLVHAIEACGSVEPNLVARQVRMQQLHNARYSRDCG